MDAEDLTDRLLDFLRAQGLDTEQIQAGRHDARLLVRDGGYKFYIDVARK